MSKELRNQLKDEKGPINGVAEEIKGQDIDEKSGAGIITAVQLTIAGKCGRMPTISYECTSNNVSCG